MRRTARIFVDRAFPAMVILVGWCVFAALVIFAGWCVFGFIKSIIVHFS